MLVVDGEKNHIALDQDILGACYSKVCCNLNNVITFYFTEFGLNYYKFPDTVKTELDAVNDCCCNARRKTKRQ